MVITVGLLLFLYASWGFVRIRTLNRRLDEIDANTIKFMKAQNALHSKSKRIK